MKTTVIRELETFVIRVLIACHGELTLSLVPKGNTRDGKL